MDSFIPLQTVDLGYSSRLSDRLSQIARRLEIGDFRYKTTHHTPSQYTICKQVHRPGRRSEQSMA